MLITVRNFSFLIGSGSFSNLDNEPDDEYRNNTCRYQIEIYCIFVYVLPIMSKHDTNVCQHSIPDK